MCLPVDPLTGAALLASAGGTFLEQREADKNMKRMVNARNDAYETGMIRQRRHADEAGAAFGQNIDKQGSQAFADQKTDEEERFKQAFGEIRTQPDVGAALPASAPKNVVLARNKASAEEGVKTDRDLEGLAALSGYGGGMFRQDLERSNFARLFGNIRDKASSDIRMLPLEMQAAENNAYKSPSLFPTLLKTGGQMLALHSAVNPTGSQLGNQQFNISDLGNAGARKDLGYSLRGGYGPYRY